MGEWGEDASTAATVSELMSPCCIRLVTSSLLVFPVQRQAMIALVEILLWGHDVTGVLTFAFTSECLKRDGFLQTLFLRASLPLGQPTAENNCQEHDSAVPCNSGRNCHRDFHTAITPIPAQSSNGTKAHMQGVHRCIGGICARCLEK